MSQIITTINRLLPFTDPSTPLWRDITHTLLLCTFLYFAPSIRWEPITQNLAIWGWKWPQEQLFPSQNTQPHTQPLRNDPPRDEPEANIPHPLETDHPDPAADGQGDHAGNPGDADNDNDNPIQRQRFANLHPDIHAAPNDQEGGEDNGDEGPAAIGGPPADAQRRRDPTRAVGAKKAKSLARRDRARAYNEFLRAQGDAQRAADAEGAEEREAVARAERERRARAERKIEEGKARERERRREEVLRERRREEQDAEDVLGVVREGLASVGYVDLGGLGKRFERERGWVEDVVRRGSLLGPRTDGAGRVILTMLLKSGWVVQVDRAAMDQVYRAAVEAGGSTSDAKVSWDELGKICTNVITSRDRAPGISAKER